MKISENATQSSRYELPTFRQLAGQRAYALAGFTLFSIVSLAILAPYQVLAMYTIGVALMTSFSAMNPSKQEKENYRMESMDQNSTVSAAQHVYPSGSCRACRTGNQFSHLNGVNKKFWATWSQRIRHWDSHLGTVDATSTIARSPNDRTIK